MLFQLYYFLENLLVETFNDFGRINYGQLTLIKWVLLAVSIGILVLAGWYSVRSLSKHFDGCLDSIYGAKQLGFWGWCQFLLNCFNEFKYAFTILIFALLLLGLIHDNYINRRYAFIRDLFVFRNIDIMDNLDNFRNADMNMNDRQNVHNSALAKYLIASVKKLQEKEQENSITAQPINEIYSEVRQYLISSTHEKSSKALEVLDYMNNMNGLHVGTNMREMEIMRLIWQRMKHPVNNQNINDFKENFMIQLADCKPNSVVMCVQGRITRIIQTLQCTDGENIVDLKPLWAIKEEIDNYFAAYADRLLERIPEKHREAFESLDRTPSQEKLVEKYNDCLKKNLNRRFKISYIDKNILTQKQLDQLTQANFENINNL